MGQRDRKPHSLEMGQREVCSPSWEETDSPSTPTTLPLAVECVGKVCPQCQGLVQTEHKAAENCPPAPAILPAEDAFPLP